MSRELMRLMFRMEELNAKVKKTNKLLEEIIKIIDKPTPDRELPNRKLDAILP